MRRGHYVELVSVVKQVCILELFISFYLIVVKDGDDFSRTVLFLLGIYQLGIGWMTRTLWKLHVKKISDRGRRLLSFIDYNIKNGRRSIKENQRE